MGIARRGVLAALPAVLAAPRLASSQGAPSRPIRIVIPFTPAGTTDLVGRLTAEMLGQRIGQQVVVENRPGASGNIAAEYVVRSDPDGNTLLLTTIGTGAINYAVFRDRMPYKPEDLAAVALMTRVPNVLMAANNTTIRSVADLVREARARPGQINYGTAGIATSPHVVVEQLRLATGIDISHVPFRGSAPMLTEMVAERIEIGMDNIPSALPFIKEGKIRAIGVTSARRNPSLPEVPTIAEQGLPGFEATAWFGLLAPAATPPAVVERLGRELNAVALSPAFRQRMEALGADPPGLTPDGGTSPATFAAFIRAEIAKWADVVSRANVRVE
ncbi:Bug family tripartite tricarboxylate transporter substrate binding protein [Neoroseomonas oryzicola]|uniref:Tripartite tricarboxylate transporter substrate binding protein n=1 Tax=Neoroseomonas oryzicola TaxID=535904 RepID=A0A9X9WJ62_9PROT|nr:tripartite tricarboxylate transporter substrate binding protein [Neoroseomonas oryzicola]MBR0660372.1 tripartite tricarboxylate transporter substrate binding protein [Neoroseomonas oryzicola]NKE18340.1 tripartite tricarboxylate transporter substrate binding protein [Neoroseomonas oryzicola]